MCSFYAYVYVFYDFIFCLSVLFSLFCKHVRLSCVFLNKLTYLLIMSSRSVVSGTMHGIDWQQISEAKTVTKWVNIATGDKVMCSSKRQIRDGQRLATINHQITYKKIGNTRMWANAERDGRPVEHRRRLLFNAAKFGWRPLLDAVQ